MEKFIRDICYEQRLIDDMNNKEYSDYLIKKFGFTHGGKKHQKSKKRKYKTLNNIILK